MAESKRYYWLKFRSDFFDSKRIKKLRNMAGGDTYCIIYLKMQLKALKTAGVLEYTGIEEQFADELALDIDERPDDVRVTLLFLLQYGLCECSDNVHYYLPWVEQNTGSETASTQAWRDWRDRKRLEEGLGREARLETNWKPIGNQLDSKGEIEKEKEIESDNKRRFTPPTVEQVREYCTERGNKVDPQTFVDFYESKGWMVGKNKMRDWKAAVRTWEKGDQTRRKQNPALKYEQTAIKKTDFDAMVVDLGGET